jgi:FkbM family methyltransferase
VVGYEAQRGLAMMANGTLALNGQWHAEVRHKAAGANTGVIQMERRDYLKEGNYGGIAGIDEGHGDAVPVTTLDHEAIALCDFLKIDVEGAEYQVLMGAKQLIRRCRPVICCEADRKDDNARVFAWLRQMGYRLYWQTPKLGSVHADISVVNVMAVMDEHVRPEGLLEVGAGEIWPDQK